MRGSLRGHDCACFEYCRYFTWRGGVMAIAATGKSIAPGVVDAGTAQRALRRITDYLASAPVSDTDVEIRIETNDQEVLVLPRPAVEMFASALAALAKGKGVSLVPVNAELTTQQAADMLNVSRPYLI